MNCDSRQSNTKRSTSAALHCLLLLASQQWPSLVTSSQEDKLQRSRTLRRHSKLRKREWNDCKTYRLLGGRCSCQFEVTDANVYPFFPNRDTSYALLKKSPLPSTGSHHGPRSTAFTPNRPSIYSCYVSFVFIPGFGVSSADGFWIAA